MGPTVAEIKESLDNLGVSYKATMRKGELVALLEVCQVNLHPLFYAPVYTPVYALVYVQVGVYALFFSPFIAMVLFHHFCAIPCSISRTISRTIHTMHVILLLVLQI